MKQFWANLWQIVSILLGIVIISDAARAWHEAIPVDVFQAVLLCFIGAHIIFQSVKQLHALHKARKILKETEPLKKQLEEFNEKRLNGIAKTIEEIDRRYR